MDAFATIYAAIIGGSAALLIALLVCPLDDKPEHDVADEYPEWQTAGDLDRLADERAEEIRSQS